MRFLFSIRYAWWLYWVKDDSIRELLTDVFLTQWTDKLLRILDARGIEFPKFDDMMLWDEYTRRRLLQGAFNGYGGLPAIYLYTMAARLGVLRDDVIPSDRELFVEATYRLCRKHASILKIATPQCQAYVEYHLQCPQFFPDRLDATAAERAFHALPDVFADPAQLAKAIKLTGEAIDRYLVTIQ